MNNRLDSLFKKIAYRNKSSYVLELFGFDTINTTKPTESVINDSVKESSYETEMILVPKIETDENAVEITHESDIQQKSSTFIANYNTEEVTQDFAPTNITEQFKSIWINLEKRRRWVYPGIFVLITSILSFYVVNSYINTQNKSNIATQEFIILSDSLNDLYFTLDDIIIISTDPFFSKYDVSNASADLQIVESKLIAYENVYTSINYDFEKISRYSNLQELEKNLTNHSLLIKQLDLLLSYRILSTEILIYPNLPITANAETISSLTIELSNISASSISNFEQLPDITIFNEHNKRLNQSIAIANELHGQYLAALRNQENETAKSLILSIDLNREFIKQSYDNSLDEFRTQVTALYNSLIPFP